MTTTDRTKMPTDVMMGRVVAEMHGWATDKTTYLYGGFWLEGPSPRPSTADPRSDPNAALELLRHLGNQPTVSIEYDKISKDWRVSYWPPKSKRPRVVHFPISGEPLRRAICWLACDVLGVE